MNDTRLYWAVSRDSRFEVWVDTEGHVVKGQSILLLDGKYFLTTNVDSVEKIVGIFDVKDGVCGDAFDPHFRSMTSLAEELEEAVVFLEFLRAAIDEKPCRIKRQILEYRLMNALHERRVQSMKESWRMALSVGPSVWLANCCFPSLEAAVMLFARLDALLEWTPEPPVPHWAEKD